MSTHGYAPWENDSAADWLAELMDQTNIAELIRTKLEEPVTEMSFEEIRAAAGMLLLIGQTYIWPIETIEGDLLLAAAKLKECQKFYTEESFKNLVNTESTLLHMRAINALLEEQQEPTARIWKQWLT